MTKEKTSNFREIRAGEISPKTLYRSNHPIYGNSQVKEVVFSANEAKIRTIVNLSDSIPLLRSKLIFCPWYNKIFREKNVISLGISMSFDILESTFLKKIRRGIKFMLEHDPPYLIHCEAGMDRTGFFAMLLESFMQAGIDEMARDYMLSYVDAGAYSHIDSELMFKFIVNTFSKIKGSPLSPDDSFELIASNYLMEKLKLKQEELLALKGKLSYNAL